MTAEHRQQPAELGTICSLPTRIGSAAHSAWGYASGEDDDLAWLRKAKAGRACRR